jgi:hypothetical protein
MTDLEFYVCVFAPTVMVATLAGIAAAIAWSLK